MATRSAIGYQLPSGKIKSVYCHWDGYPQHHGPILESRYNSIQAVRELIRPGSISCLRTRTTWTSGKALRDEEGNPITDRDGFWRHENDRDPQPLYYHERGDGDPPVISSSLEAAKKRWPHCCCEYLYIFSEKTGWQHFKL